MLTECSIPTDRLVLELVRRMDVDFAQTIPTTRMVDLLLRRMGFDPGIVVSGAIYFDADRTLTAMAVRQDATSVVAAGCHLPNLHHEEQTTNG